MPPFRQLAPAGAPIRGRDLLRFLPRLLTAHTAPAQLRSAIAARFGVPHCELMVTGRAGLTVALAALRGLGSPTRDEVVVPAYTCFSVPASAVKAGLRVRLVDVDPLTLDFDRDRLRRIDWRRVLAVVATNLYGLPSDMPALVTIAREHDAYIVDDAAQAMGAAINGRASGTWGDVGLFSLDKGKGVSAVDGGILVAWSAPVAHAIERIASSLPRPGGAATAAWLAKVAVYAGCLRPEMYWLPNSIPQLGLGTTVYTHEFRLERMHPAVAALATVMLERLSPFLAARRSNADDWRRRLTAVAGAVPAAPHPAASASYLRLPLLTRDTATRDRIVGALRAAGIGASASYPTSIADVSALRPYLVEDGPVAGARDVAMRLMTLPTHPFVTSNDVRRGAEVLVRLSSARGAVRPYEVGV